ncbi:hypothetical protein [Pseudonocardia abyssalis]|uniref:Uncharacterized protein n=1 Tax=Pseudonocardia abyssalis TaxID=2792008 RepID=A0ABS6UMG3_9PSEU|nr:hypothetical protein [Pseudonocardia abyssalis]MBW0119549.1 hypothetical protein [Pseudonocardia abyssalis]MBW0133121.1 hypothetical protein [Pseudonocardia abyssalis]
MNRYPREPSSLLRPARRTLWSRLAVPLAVLAVPVGTALGGALLTTAPPPVVPLTDQTVRLGCADDGDCDFSRP